MSSIIAIRTNSTSGTIMEKVLELFQLQMDQLLKEHALEQEAKEAAKQVGLILFALTIGHLILFLCSLHPLAFGSMMAAGGSSNNSSERTWVAVTSITLLALLIVPLVNCGVSWYYWYISDLFMAKIFYSVSLAASWPCLIPLACIACKMFRLLTFALRSVFEPSF